MSGDNTNKRDLSPSRSRGECRAGVALSDASLLRYARHVLLDEIGIDGQQRLLAATALIIGAGGLGSPVALYLAASGIGRIVIADDDTVELSNLQRQIAHDHAQLGRNKAESAAARMRGMNPEIEVVALPRRLQGDELQRVVAEADVVIDCSDNFATRYAINAACVAAHMPLVSGAAVRFDGQISVFPNHELLSGAPRPPCYACLFPEGGEDAEMRCAEFGVFAPLVGLIGSFQAAEALKLLLGVGTTLAGRLYLYNALDAEWRTVRIPHDPHCPVCGAGLVA